MINAGKILQRLPVSPSATDRREAFAPLATFSFLIQDRHKATVPYPRKAFTCTGPALWHWRKYAPFPARPERKKIKTTVPARKPGWTVAIPMLSE